MKPIRVIVAALLGCTLALEAADELPRDHRLRSLYDRADLIVDATFLRDFGGGFIKGPAPKADPQTFYVTDLPRIFVNDAIKGSLKAGDRPLVEVTVPQVTQDPYITYQGYGSFPEAFAKDERAILFLEDSGVRNPSSITRVGDEVVLFRTFDLYLWKLPASPALDLQLRRYGSAAP